MSPFDKDERLGSIRVFKDATIINAKTTERALHEARTVVFIIIASVVLVFFVTYLLITKPVEILSKKLQEIDFSHTKVSLSESKRNDEIGTIAQALNTLFSNAATQIQREKLLVLQTQLLTNNFKMTFDLSKSPLAVIDKDFSLISFNAAFRHLFVDDIDITDSNFVSHWLEWMITDPKSVLETLARMEEMNSQESVEVRMSTMPKVQVPDHVYSVTFVKTEDSLGQINYLIFMDDITEHKRKLAATEKVANQDHLTHLLNRAAGQREISYALSTREDNETIALAVLDLDGFKQMNDRYGHDAGDQVLQVIAERIQSITRSSDIVVRWGGDEFVLGLLKVNAVQAQQIGEKIVRALGEVIPYKGIELQVGVSVGIAITNKRSINFSSLFTAADKAMYEVKKEGKNNILLTMAS